MILGHRLSELCGHGPSLETDIALTNISLDLFGQVRSYFQYAAKIEGGDATEDSIAYLRHERKYLSSTILEQENTDFAHVIVRQFLFDVYHRLLLEELQNSKDDQIAAIATKSLKEVKYHLRFSTSWMNRLGAGTEESNQRMQVALDYLLPMAHELVTASEVENAVKIEGIAPDLDVLSIEFWAQVKAVIQESNLKYPEFKNRVVRGKQGIHSEHMGRLLSEFQYMQRAYPNMQW